MYKDNIPHHQVQKVHQNDHSIYKFRDLPFRNWIGNFQLVALLNSHIMVLS